MDQFIPPEEEEDPAASFCEVGVPRPESQLEVDEFGVVDEVVVVLAAAAAAMLAPQPLSPAALPSPDILRAASILAPRFLRAPLVG